MLLPRCLLADARPPPFFHKVDHPQELNSPGAALQTASERDLNDLFKATGIGAVTSVLLKSALKGWKQAPADAIERAAASKVWV